MKKLRVVCFAMVLTLVGVAFGGCAGKPGGDACSIFIYMCGSNLETKQGLAGKNLNELLEADIPADTRIIVQTGGSTTWRSHDIKSDKLQRYEIRDKKLVLLEELDNANMGAKSTFEDFLTWSTGAYGSKRNILVLWDHGGKSADKICFDENFDYDSLDRSELAAAFKDAKLPFTFDILVFDACFMSTLENAALASDYARYMVASQEVVPSGGIDYGALAKDFTTHENKDLGVSICDSYLKK
ncbi:MAG: clostripain-related cysteine peptidase, partial [Atopobiaceae bacterium]|nr:clostripain-related cysteine peptidase [Atopobiaceae bacterium]